MNDQRKSPGSGIIAAISPLTLPAYVSIFMLKLFTQPQFLRLPGLAPRNGIPLGILFRHQL